MTEQTPHNPEQETEQSPYFVVAKRLEHNPDPKAPVYEIEDQPVETLPELSADQFTLMGGLGSEEKTAENLENLGLPVGEGIVAVSVDGEKRYVNISLEEYGTVVTPNRIVETHEQESSQEAAGLKRELATEFAYTAELADTIANNLRRPEEDEHFRSVRRNAAEALDTMVRDALHSSQIPSNHDVEPIIDMFRTAARSFHEAQEYRYEGDSIQTLAARIDSSRNQAEVAATHYFQDHEPKEEAELIHDLHRAKAEQINMSALLREEIATYADRLDREDKDVDENIADMNRKFMNMTEFDDRGFGIIYAQVQEVMRAISDSDGVRHKLDIVLQQLNTHNADLKALTEKLAE